MAVDGDLSNTATTFDPTNSTVNTANNFGYDAIGNLTRDESEEIADIAWDTYGKIKGITRTSGSTKPDLLFIYTPTGERALKVEMTKNPDGTLTAASAWNFTGYMRDAGGNVMNTVASSNGPNNRTNEYGLFGSSRLGTWSPNIPATYLDGLSARGDDYRLAGDKSYELTNHLGNVMVVVGDKKLGDDSNGDGMANSYHADVLSMNDYYAFGMQMPGRTYSSPSYRYGFNGKEKDDETYGVGGSSYDYGFRIYNSRLGRFLSVDPLTKKYV